MQEKEIDHVTGCFISCREAGTEKFVYLRIDQIIEVKKINNEVSGIRSHHGIYICNLDDESIICEINDQLEKMRSKLLGIC